MKKTTIKKVLGASETNTVSAPRNPYANHPLMRKGGTHQKSKSAERSQNRRDVKKMARDWSSKIINLFFASLK